MIDEIEKRRQMVECQIKPFSVTDPDVLAVMARVSRESFIEDSGLRANAYLDIDVLVDSSDSPRMMLAAATLARLLQEARLHGDEETLVVGCGLGYTLAVLGMLGLKPEGLECHKSLVDRAPLAFEAAGVSAWPVHHGELELGIANRVFDLVLIEGAVSKVSEALLANVKDGGRLVMFEVSHGVSQAVCFRKVGGIFNRMALFEAPAPILPGFKPDDVFVF